MTPELIYMLKVNVGIALFYAFYKLFCGSDTFFKWRRIALLSFLTLSFLYPLLNIQTWIKEQPAIYELTDYYTLLITGNTNTNNEIATTAVTDLVYMGIFYRSSAALRPVHHPIAQHLPALFDK